MKSTKLMLKLDDFRREKAMMLLFTPKQIVVMSKIMAMQKLSTRENEDYSRRIKPRLNAILDFYQTALVLRAKS